MKETWIVDNERNISAAGIDYGDDGLKHVFQAGPMIVAEAKGVFHLARVYKEDFTDDGRLKLTVDTEAEMKFAKGDYDDVLKEIRAKAVAQSPYKPMSFTCPNCDAELERPCDGQSDVYVHCEVCDVTTGYRMDEGEYRPLTGEELEAPPPKDPRREQTHGVIEALISEDDRNTYIDPHRFEFTTVGYIRDSLMKAWFGERYGEVFEPKSYSFDLDLPMETMKGHDKKWAGEFAEHALRMALDKDIEAVESIRVYVLEQVDDDDLDKRVVKLTCKINGLLTARGLRQVKKEEEDDD